MKTAVFGDEDPTVIKAIEEICGARPDYLLEMAERRERAMVGYTYFYLLKS